MADIIWTIFSTYRRVTDLLIDFNGISIPVGLSNVYCIHYMSISAFLSSFLGVFFFLLRVYKKFRNKI